MKERILLIGGGGHCKACIDVIEQEGRFQIHGIIDREENIGQTVLGYPIIGCDEQLPLLLKKCSNALVTVGQIKTAALRKKLFLQLKEIGYCLPVIQSPLAYISVHSAIGEGTIIMHHAIVNAAAHIGKNCIINTKSLIEHDAAVEDHCHISTGSILNGGVTVQSGSFFGSNATSKEYVTIPENGFIKAHSLYKGKP